VTQAEYQAAATNEKRLQNELDQQKAFVLGLNDAAVQYAILEREVDTNRQLYNSVLQRMKDVGLAAEVESSAVSIIDKAHRPGAPSSPKRFRDILASAGVGLVAGLAIAFLLEYL